MDINKKIIHDYLSNQMPEQVRRQFLSWCLDEKDHEEKEQLLQEEWNRLEPEKILGVDEKAYVGKLQRLHRDIACTEQMRRRYVGGRSRIWRMAISVAACVAVIIVAACTMKGVNAYIDANTFTTYVVAEGCRGQFTLPDGSRVWLNSEARLSYNRNFLQGKLREVKLDGEGYFEVEKNPQRPFVVQMNKMKVRVKGTSFDACNSSKFGVEEVTLLTGAVEVEHCGLDRTVSLTPNHSFRYDANTGKCVVREIDARDYCGWHTSAHVFENKSLAEILTCVERCYNVRFNIEDDVDTSVRLSFVLSDEKIDDVLELIAKLAEVNYYKMNKYSILIYKH